MTEELTGLFLLGHSVCIIVLSHLRLRRLASLHLRPSE